MHCEFQAVILAAGRGSRMTDLTSGTPKCLLPVGGKPVLYHVIRVLEKAGIQDVLITVLEDEINEIVQTMNQYNTKAVFEFISIPIIHEDWGTADSLRYLIGQDKIRNDILLVSCDLFTNASINKLLHTYRKHKASFAALFFLPMQCEQIQVPGSKSKYKPEKDLVGIDPLTSRLVFLASVSDFEENVSVGKNILKRHPKLNLRTDLIDGHFYAMTYNLAKYLASETAFSTIKGEFLPYVVSKQHIRKSFGREDSSILNDSGKKSLFDFMKESKMEENIKEMSTFNDHEGDLNKAYHGDVLKCYAVVENENYFGIRINCLQALCQANKLCLEEEARIGSDIMEMKIHPTASIETKQIDSASCVGASSKIMEKTSIKTSVICESCTINSKTRISKCIVLKKVKISDGCILDNCIIANDARIGRNSELKNCLIGSNFFVADGTKENNQVLTKSEGLMEI